MRPGPARAAAVAGMIPRVSKLYLFRAKEADVSTRSRRRRRPSRALFTALAVTAVLAVPAVSAAQANGAIVQGTDSRRRSGQSRVPCPERDIPVLLDVAGPCPQSVRRAADGIVSGAADAYSATGVKTASNVLYRTRIVVRRPLSNVRLQRHCAGGVRRTSRRATTSTPSGAAGTCVRDTPGSASRRSASASISSAAGAQPATAASASQAVAPHGRRALVRHLRPGRPGAEVAGRGRSAAAGSTSNASSRSAPRSRPAG